MSDREMSEELPVVSVVMAVYNAGDYLEGALSSILVQDYPRFEFIIIDDGSTDGSLELLRECSRKDSRILLHQQQHGGPAAARNLGISLARGEYVAIMDADDLAESSRLNTQVKYLEEHHEVVALGCRLRLIDPAGEMIAEERDRPTSHTEIMKMLLTGLGAIPNPGAMIRGETLREIGGYSPQYVPAEDVDLWLRLSERGDLANCPEILLNYRLHANSLGSSKRDLQNQVARSAVLAHYERRGDTPPDPLVLNLPEPCSAAEERLRWAWMSAQGGNWKGARRYSRAALALAPFSLRVWYVWVRIRLGLTKSFRRTPR